MNKNKIWLVVLVAAILRLITLPSLLTFTADESYLSYIAQTIIKDFHIIWIGWSALGFDLYLGPFWIYVISPFLMLSKGDPIILGYLGSVMGIACVLLLYWLGEKIFSKKVGLIAAVLYGCLPLIVFYDQKPYPPGVALLSLLLVFALFMTQRSNKWWLVFAAAYGMVFHVHLSLVLVILVAVYWAWLQRKSLTKKIVFSSILIFLLMVSPLIAFDYFHKASNITAPFRALKAIQNTKTSAFPSHLNSLYQSLGRIWYLKPYTQSSDEIIPSCSSSQLSTFTKPPWLISGLSALILLFFALNKQNWHDKKKRLLLLVSLTFLVPYALLPIINPVEYYLTGFLPLFFLMTALTIEKFDRPLKYPAYFLISAAIAVGILTIFIAKGDFGLKAKKRLISKVSTAVGNQPFYLTTEGECQKVGGWRYLFSVYGKRPEQSSDDLIFGWLYPDELSDKSCVYSVIINESRASLTTLPPDSYESVITEGGFTAYIIRR